MEDPEKFYSRGAEKFAESHSIDQISDEYIQVMDKFLEESSGPKILDAGCGTGRDVQYFIDQGFDAEGIDVAEGMLEYARENHEGRYTKMDVRNLEYSKNTFHGIWCNTVLIFLPPEEMIEVLQEFSRVLKDRGVLHLGLKLGEGEFIRQKYGGEVKQHLVKEDEAREMLEKAGFQIIDMNISETGEKYSFGNIICRKTD